MNPTTIDKELEYLRALEKELTQNPANLCDFEGCDEDAVNALICPNSEHKHLPHVGEKVCAPHSSWLLHEAARHPDGSIFFSKTCKHEEVISECSMRSL